MKILPLLFHTHTETKVSTAHILSAHLSQCFVKKPELISRLQAPIVNNSVNVEASYHGYVSKYIYIYIIHIEHNIAK